MTITEIKAFMKLNKITQIDLSNTSAIPLGTVRQIFSGKTLNPRKDTMDAIMNALENFYNLHIEGKPLDLNYLKKFHKNKIIVIDHFGNVSDFDFKEDNIEQILEVCEIFTKDKK